VVATHRWVTRVPPSFSVPFVLEPDAKARVSVRRACAALTARAQSERRRVPLLATQSVQTRHFALTPDCRTLLTVAHWDNTVKLVDVESGKTVQSLLVRGGSTWRVCVRALMCCVAGAQRRGDVCRDCRRRDNAHHRLARHHCGACGVCTRT
jgi:hypothetical protein